MYALEIENLTKKYKIYAKPSDRLKEIIFKKDIHREFAALNGVTFKVPVGQTLGIIGDNGAGKSTLLQILAGTLAPTEGKVIKRGNVAALLELGAGFHPDFTGRQNIYLNASLLGMDSKYIKEIEEKIIDFSELGNFIDLPVKTYSSGMYVRLAFSIATSIEPDILIIDEALSVGDQYFQKKCIDRMMDFCKSGKTILFCSHSIYHLQELCEKAVWLHNGEVKLHSGIKKVINEYQSYVLAREKKEDEFKSCDNTDKIAYITNVWLENSNGEKIKEVKTDETIIIKMQVRTNNKKMIGHIGFGINRTDETLVFASSTLIDGYERVEIKNGKIYSVILNDVTLLNGKYKIFGTIIDETGFHFYDVFKTEPIDVVSDYGFYGISKMEHQWKL